MTQRVQQLFDFLTERSITNIRFTALTNDPNIICDSIESAITAFEQGNCYKFVDPISLDGVE